MEYLYIKALHIIFVITWFSGLFYMVRLFIYHVEANDKEETERKILQKQYKLMEKRLWYMITWPSAILASMFAFYLLYLVPSLLMQTWMFVKLSFVLLLYLYHFSCQKIYKQLLNNHFKYSSTQLRIWNEVATIILFAVVFLVVLKTNTSWIWGVTGLLVFSAIIMFFVKIYKKRRNKKDWEKDINL